jgi:hypothetical protein
MNKPERLIIHPENIPVELIEQNNWIVWRWEFRKNKWTKPPYQINGKDAKSNDSSTWIDFNTAYEAFKCTEDWDGIGFVINKDSGYTGLDWDDCLECGNIIPEIKELIYSFDSYTEMSPSKKGMKTLIRGLLPGTGHHSKNIGVFDSNRYFCITGHLLNGFSRKIESRQKELDVLIKKYWPMDFKVNEQKPIPIPFTDHEIIEKALSANDGGKFRKLWSGDHSDYTSKSEADLALCCKLSFWVDRDYNRIDALFRNSDLYRDKWERDDYRRKTIERAIEISSDTYSKENITTHNKSITNHNNEPKKESIGPTDAIINFLENCSNREFSFRDCFNHVKQLCGTSVNEPTVRTILHRFVKQGKRIAAHEKAGHYRIVSCEFKLMDLYNAKSIVTDIELPLDLNHVVDLKAGQIVLVAGVTNTGKTSFMLDLMARNMKRWRVRYLNSEMDADEFRSVLDSYKGVKRFEDWRFEPVRIERHMHPADLILPGYGNLNILDYLEPPEAKYAADWVAQIHDRLDGAVAVISVQRHKDRDFGHGGPMLNSRPRLVLNLDWRKCTIIKVKFWKRKETGWNPNGMYFEWEMRDGWEPHKISKLMNTQDKYDNLT